MKHIIRITEEDGKEPYNDIHNTLKHLIQVTSPDLFTLEGPEEAVERWLDILISIYRHVGDGGGREKARDTRR